MLSVCLITTGLQKSKQKDCEQWMAQEEKRRHDYVPIILRQLLFLTLIDLRSWLSAIHGY
jgi:hypothetical protein